MWDLKFSHIWIYCLVFLDINKRKKNYYPFYYQYPIIFHFFKWLDILRYTEDQTTCNVLFWI